MLLLKRPRASIYYSLSLLAANEEMMLLYTHVPRVALASSNQILSLFAHRQWIDLMKFGKKAAAQIASRHCANVRKITDDCRDNNLGYHPSSFSLGEGSSLVIYFALHLRVLSGIMIMISICSDIILKVTTSWCAPNRRFSGSAWLGPKSLESAWLGPKNPNELTGTCSLPLAHRKLLPRWLHPLVAE